MSVEAKPESEVAERDVWEGSYRLLERSIDWFIPPGVRDVRQEQYRRARLIVSTSIIFGFVALIFAHQAYTVRSTFTPDIWVILTGAALAFGNLFILKLSRSVTFTGALAMLEAAALILVGAYYNGGLTSAGILWLPAVPLLTAFLLGPRWAFVSAAGISLSMWAFYQLHASSHFFPRFTSPGETPWFLMLAASILSFFLAFLGWHYEDMRRRSQGAVTQVMAGVLHMNKKLSDTRSILTRSEARFRSLVQNSSDITTLMDAEGIIGYSSPSVLRIIGYTPEELEGRNAFELVHPDDLPRVKEAFSTLLSGAENVMVEYRFLTRERQWRWLESLGRNLITDPTVGAVVVNTRDVTERKEFEAKLIAAKNEAEAMSRLKTSFLSNFSHEIRTPLAGIIGFANVLGQEVDEEKQEVLKMIERSGNRLLETLNSILDLSRLESNSMELRPIRIDLSEAIREIAMRAEAQAKEKDLALNLKLPALPVYLQLDRECFSRVLTYLVSNAIKFTNSGGVTITLEPVAYRVNIHVTDTGIGISDHFKPLLFQEFKQESSGLGRSYEGSGLGLSVTKRFVDLMGGSIAVESTQGKGSTFTLSFPVTAALPASEKRISRKASV